MSESKRQALVEEVFSRLLARLNIPPQESFEDTRHLLQLMIQQDPSLKDVINSLIEEICEELEQEDDDCIKYSISSQICPEEGNFKLRYNIDFLEIMDEKSCSERPTPHAKTGEIAEYIQESIYSGKLKNKSEIKQSSPEYTEGLHKSSLEVEDLKEQSDEEDKEENLLLQDEEELEVSEGDSSASESLRVDDEDLNQDAAEQHEVEE